MTWILARAGFSGEGLLSITLFLWVPLAWVLIYVNARLFPPPLELVSLPPDRVEENGEAPANPVAQAALNESLSIPAPWAPGFQTIEPPTTFAGVAIAVLIACVLGYEGWVAIDAVVARFTPPSAEAPLSTDILPIGVELADDTITVTSRSWVLWKCTLMIPTLDTAFVATVEIPPMQTRRVWYNAFR